MTTREPTSHDDLRVVGHRLQQVDASARVTSANSRGIDQLNGQGNGQVNGQQNGQMKAHANGRTVEQRIATKASGPAPSAPDPSAVLRQVVLVDREIDGLRDIAIALRDEYDFHITISGAEALNLLRDGAIDTIVVGQTLYSSTGLAVLAEARRHAPHTHRVLLANAVESGSIDRGAAAVSPFKVMQRPCTAEKLRELLEANAAPNDEPAALTEQVPQAAYARRPADTHNPADFEHVVMETPPERPRFNHKVGPTPNRTTLGVESLPAIVYTDNGEFYQAITLALQDRHEVRLCTQLDRAAELAEMGMCPILITDRAATQVELQQIAIPLRAVDAGMITIAAGSPEVGAALRKLLGTDALHSFLPKPISAPLVRLAVESAKRNYLQARALRQKEPELTPVVKRTQLKPTPQPTAPKSATPLYMPSYRNDFMVDDYEESPWRQAAPKIAIAAVVLIGLVVGGWYAWGEYSRRQLVAQGEAKSSTDALVAGEITLAQRAFDVGHYSVGDDSAIYHFNQALKLAPQNPVALAGIERSTERLIEQAEKALTDEQVDAAADAIATVRTLQPNSKRLPFLERQLEKERRQLTAQRAAAKPIASAQPTTVPQVITAPGPREPISNETQRRQLIARWLATAHQRLIQDRLISPENDNAEFYLRQVERTDPGNASMQQGLREIGTRLLTHARDALASQQLDLAKRRADESLRFGSDSSTVEQLKLEIEAAAGATTRDNLLRLTLQRTRDNRLFEPDRDSAKFYLGQLQRIDPMAQETEQALRAVAFKLIENADRALAQQQINSATQMLNEVRRLGFNGPELTAAEARARAIRTPSTPTKSAEITPPKIIKTVPPKFPDDAVRAGAEGWVDVRFLITANGDVTDVTPVGSSTSNQFTVPFERAAVAAIKQYKFEARDISQSQTQSMVVRVQFKSQ